MWSSIEECLWNRSKPPLNLKGISIKNFWIRDKTKSKCFKKRWKILKRLISENRTKTGRFEENLPRWKIIRSLKKSQLSGCKMIGRILRKDMNNCISNTKSLTNKSWRHRKIFRNSNTGWNSQKNCTYILSKNTKTKKYWETNSRTLWKTSTKGYQPCSTKRRKLLTTSKTKYSTSNKKWSMDKEDKKSWKTNLIYWTKP